MKKFKIKMDQLEAKAGQGYVIIDIGTGNVRVAVATECGELLSIQRTDLQNCKDSHYSEALYFSPQALWEQICALVAEALRAAPALTIMAITATSQREGIVMIGNSGESIIGLPNIDHRGREWESIITDKSRVYELTGRYPTSLFSALKVVGVRERRPEIFKQYATFLSISDWVEYELSGILHYEHSQASETLLYNVGEHCWSEELCKIFGIDCASLPKLTRSGTILSKILPAQADMLGVSPEVQIIVGGADTQLAIVSTQPQENDVVMVSGTTTPIVKVVRSYITDAHERTWTSRHVDGLSYILEANAGVTGLNYQRLKEVFYPNEDYSVIEHELNNIADVRCMASLGSLLADEKVPLTRGGFIFDTPVSHLLTRACFVWATLWDIACSIKENYDTLCKVTSHDKDYIWACGGGMQSQVLRQFIANLTQRAVRVRSNYCQSSVAGGVIICNKALGIEAPLSFVLEEVQPEINEKQSTLYAQWKQTRESFIEQFV